jgi:hypothetical protein
VVFLYIIRLLLAFPLGPKEASGLDATKPMDDDGLDDQESSSIDVYYSVWRFLPVVSLLLEAFRREADATGGL